MGKPGGPAQRMMKYIGIPGIDLDASRVRQLGGSVVVSRIIVPGFGHLAICIDTEGNTFWLWQDAPGES